MKNLSFLKNNYYFKRVNLEKLSLKHLNDIHEYSIDKRFFKYFESPKFKSKNQTKKYIKQKLEDVKKINTFWWAIKLNCQDKVIGTICIHNINYLRKTCEVGYGINPNYWGKGYFVEVLKGLIKMILTKNRFLRCQAITSKKNTYSIKGLKKCGFKIEGILKNFYRDNKYKKNFDAVILSKIIR